jgi:hypothetical protein
MRMGEECLQLKIVLEYGLAKLVAQPCRNPTNVSTLTYMKASHHIDDVRNTICHASLPLKLVKGTYWNISQQDTKVQETSSEKVPKAKAI